MMRSMGAVFGLMCLTGARRSFPHNFDLVIHALSCRFPLESVDSIQRSSIKKLSSSSRILWWAGRAPYSCGDKFLFWPFVGISNIDYIEYVCFAGPTLSFFCL